MKRKEFAVDSEYSGSKYLRDFSRGGISSKISPTVLSRIYCIRKDDSMLLG